ncbi:MAG: hypothetical protein IKB42_00525 [Clostridia bacterium]|nr:hypothetical protein [Clostridia bacterium]
MPFKNHINELKEYILDHYNETKKQIAPEIYRGHLRSLSTDIEDGIALFLSKIFTSHKIYIDPSVTVNKQTHRPDILIVNSEKEVVAMLEIKTQMGYCRDATGVIDKIKAVNEIFKKEKTLNCKFSNNEIMPVTYTNDVKLFLISFSSNNCSKETYHTNNKSYAKNEGVNYYILFDNWYNDLKNFEIEDFVEEISKLK